MKVLPNSAVSCLLAILIFANSNLCLAAENKFALSAVAYDTAQQLDIVPLIEQLQALQNEPSTEAIEIKKLQLKQRLTNSVLIATLQVRDVTARIEWEISRLNRMLEYLEDRRDKALKINTISNAIGMGAMMTTGQAMEMGRNEIPGEIVQTIAGGIIIILSAWSLHIQSGGKARVQAKPNMLSKVFHNQTDKNSDYPLLVWSYLNRVPVDSTDKRTRLEGLFQHWKRYELIGNKNGTLQIKRVARLTNSDKKCTESIDLIGDQLALLSDLKTEIYQLDRDLLELLMNTQTL